MLGYVRMRRNLTISFDEDFIPRMDEARGEMSRGAWIESLSVSAPASENFKLGAPRVETAAPRRPRAGEATEEPVSRADAFRGATQKRGEG